MDVKVKRRVLEVIAASRGKASTRTVDLRLTSAYPHPGVTALDLLKALEAEGLAKRFVGPDVPMDRWELTGSGETWLDRARGGE